MKTQKITSKYYARILLELIKKWNTLDFSNYSDDELKLLNILTDREIASKNDNSFRFNYSFTEFTNVRKTPLDFEELELLRAAIEEIENKKTQTFTILNKIVNSSITKSESKILFELINLEIHKNKTVVTQKELLEFYNKKHFDEIEEFDQSIKQSHISRALKNLKEQEFVDSFQIRKEKMFYVNWDMFSV